MLWPWLYAEMDEEIANAKPIEDVNKKAELPHEFPPSPPVITEEPTTSDPKPQSEPTTASPPLVQPESTTVPQKGRNITIGVSDSVASADR